MKHYTHFLKKRTPYFIQLGKISNAISYDIEETERKLKALKQQREEIENEYIVKFSVSTGLALRRQ